MQCTVHCSCLRSAQVPRLVFNFLYKGKELSKTIFISAGSNVFGDTRSDDEDQVESCYNYHLRFHPRNYSLLDLMTNSSPQKKGCSKGGFHFLNFPLNVSFPFQQNFLQICCIDLYMIYICLTYLFPNTGR